MNKPVVAIFSDSNFFSIHLVESLLSKSCNVIIFAPDENDWVEKTNHIANKMNLQITEEKNFVSTIPITYSIFCQGFQNQKKAYEIFRSIYSKGDFKKIKSLAIFPYEVYDVEESSSLPLNNNLSIIYLGDILSPRMETDGQLRMGQLTEEILFNHSITFGLGEVFYPLFAPYAAKQISKWVFSFGPYGKEVFVGGQEVSAGELWRQVNQLIPGVTLGYDKSIKLKNIPRNFTKDIVATNLAYCLKETLRGVAARIRAGRKLPRVNTYLPKKINRIAIALGIVLFLPVLLLIFSASLLFASYKLYLSGNTPLTKGTMLVSSASARIGKAESQILKYIPILGLVYREIDYGLYFVYSVSDIGLGTLPLTETSKDFVGKILGDEIYDPESLSSEIGSSLETLYRQVSIAEAETKQRAVKGEILAAKVLDIVDFERIKSLSLSGSRISQSIGGVLGKSGRKTYLVMFQNNTELRPTGGFIGSFALVTFEGGRMTDFSVSDVYSADGQLRGHIEPPKPLKDYLGEASWFLRDSNWDPDFPTSAKRAEWFIDKEIDRKVDGVIALDLRPVKDFLRYTGDIYLPDYEMNITSENLYERTQEEVQEDFFPGTHKKASFLTALSRNLVTTLGELDGTKKLGILKVVFDSLEARHIQVYFHEGEIQGQISELGWAGEVKGYSCGQSCYSDFVGLVEANVGVNKANYFVSRDQSLVIDTSGGKVTRNLTINFMNSANPNLGVPAKYKAYVRVMLPSESQVEGNFEVSEARGFKEVGFLVEVLAGQAKSYTLTWSSTFSDFQNYGLFVRKQAGTEEVDKLSVAIDGMLVYNSNLAKDTWIQKR